MEQKATHVSQSVCPGCRRPLTHGVVLTRNGRREHTDCTGARLLELEDAVERIWLATGSFQPDHVAGEIHAIAEEVCRARWPEPKRALASGGA